MKTYLDVVNETVEYYKTNPFGYDKDKEVCTYFGPNGEMCAVGRCLNSPIDLSNKSDYAVTVIRDGLGGGLKDEYKHLIDHVFWLSLQEFHDDSANKGESIGKKSLKKVTALAIKLDAKTKEG